MSGFKAVYRYCIRATIQVQGVEFRRSPKDAIRTIVWLLKELLDSITSNEHETCSVVTGWYEHVGNVVEV